MEKMDGFDALTRNWTRRQVLAAGGLALCGLAGCGTTDQARTTSSNRVIPPSTSPALTPASASLTSMHEAPITLAFMGDIMIGRTVNSHMLATAPNDLYMLPREREKCAMQSEHIQIQQATRPDALTIVDMVGRLLSELGGFHAFDAGTALTLCEELLATEHYTALLARDLYGLPLGVLTLQACPALYVAGYVGWIQELSVIPEARSYGVGHRLLMEANIYAQERQWRRLEVNTPDISSWPRTVAFYRREGFTGESSHLKSIPGETS